MQRYVRTLFAFSVVLALSLPTAAQTRAASPAKGRLVLETVHGFSLEDTVTGENPDRTVAIYLPPSYDEAPDRCYPVVYFLHGISGTHADWTVRWAEVEAGWDTLQGVMDRTIAQGRVSEMILVAADQRTKGGGSFYTNSEVTGGWEDFTVVDLVDHVDSRYRTLATADSRGVAGHSMGGYGAIKLGMKHPDVYAVVYGMGSALFGFAGDIGKENRGFAVAARATPASLNPRADFWPPSLLCVAQAFSPNPDKPPFYADLPFLPGENGELVRQESTYARWEAQMPLQMLSRYAESLKSLRGVRFDCGRQEQFTHIPLTNRLFSDRLIALGVPHVYEEYNGDHRDKLWGPEGRIATEVLPYFSRLLVRE